MTPRQLLRLATVLSAIAGYAVFTGNPNAGYVWVGAVLVLIAAVGADYLERTDA